MARAEVFAADEAAVWDATVVGWWWRWWIRPVRRNSAGDAEEPYELELDSFRNDLRVKCRARP